MNRIIPYCHSAGKSDFTDYPAKLDREAAHRDGILHRTSHVWIVRLGPNGRDQVLLARLERCLVPATP